MGDQDTIEPGACCDIPQLMQVFESLGENCDLGVVQRAIGIEPFGLFRFSACKVDDVAMLLRTRFKELAETDDLWLEEMGPTREYWVKSRHSSFEAHTDRFGGVDDPEIARTAQIERIRFLKSRLIRDLAYARRLFVYKGKAELEDVREIVAQLRSYGPNTLLWVNIADAAHPAGSVERHSQALLLGFVSRFGSYDGVPSLPVEEWIAICASAYRLWRGIEPPKSPIENLIDAAVAEGSCHWFADTEATTRALDEIAPAGKIIFEHKLGRSEATAVCSVFLPITTGGSYVFSAWVRIPHGSHLRQIVTYFPGFSTIAIWVADVKPRAQWQRIWVTAALPADATEITCAIIAEGAIGAEFHSASWCLERGSQPLGFGFVL